MLQFDFALWLRFSSFDPDIVTLREVDPLLTAQEAVMALMQELRELYVYRASVKTPYSLERFWRLSLPVPDDPPCQVPAIEIVNTLWSIVEEDGIDPVEVTATDALGLVRAWAYADPGSLLASWCHSALAADERFFADRWNDRRSALARRRLWLEESEVPDGNAV